MFNQETSDMMLAGYRLKSSVRPRASCPRKAHSESQTRLGTPFGALFLALCNSAVFAARPLPPLHTEHCLTEN